MKKKILVFVALLFASVYLGSIVLAEANRRVPVAYDAGFNRLTIENINGADLSVVYVDRGEISSHTPSPPSSVRFFWDASYTRKVVLYNSLSDAHMEGVRDFANRYKMCSPSLGHSWRLFELDRCLSRFNDATHIKVSFYGDDSKISGSLVDLFNCGRSVEECITNLGLDYEYEPFYMYMPN